MAQQPILTLSEAIKMGLQNFNSIKAKQRYQEASSVMVDNARRQFLPDVNTAIQQNYGTANGQFGPLYSYKGVGIAAAGPNATSQNWNTAFGALYATNINWEAYSFGRLAATLEVAKSQVVRDSLDVLQEKFAILISRQRIDFCHLTTTVWYWILCYPMAMDLIY